MKAEITEAPFCNGDFIGLQLQKKTPGGAFLGQKYQFVL